MNRREFIEGIKAEVLDWAKNNTDTFGEKSSLLREISDCLWESLVEEAPETDRISAPNAVVEVIDQRNGVLYRRYLELAYEENDNGIRLVGEDMTGREVQVVYLSESALKKMHDLRGSGPDKPRCNH